MKTLNDIKEILTKNKTSLLAKYPISQIAIFGSYARNENNEQSDVDILVDINSKIGTRFIDLANEIETLLGCKVDLVSKNGIKPHYLAAINSELIYV